MDRRLSAVDVGAATDLLKTHGRASQSALRAIPVSDLPVVDDVTPSVETSDQAILSWRWDVDAADGSSRNVAVAVAHAAESGIEHLFLDAVSIDQRLVGFDLIRAVADFTTVFGQVQTLAAYDIAEPPGLDRHFLRVLRRPWIAREVGTMRHNPHPIRYIGHIADQGAAESFGFAHMARRIWTTTFSNSILYVLGGFCDMHDISELALIMPHHAAVLVPAAEQMSRNDTLVAAALLSQLSTDDARVNGDISMRDAALERFEFRPAEGSVGFWSNWDIVLDEKSVGQWSEKDYTRDGSPRRKLAAAPNAKEILAAHLSVDSSGDDPSPADPAPERSAEDVANRIEVFDLSNRFPE